eukprot:TRINITY_DN54190_c0_g1_i1.p1 TRINITY_DN54190_c0_g1~~TRINITY_DN54190_c0_g1_i1.p1  ORF type:complete len:204 (-),score=24.70 TRINITY_DN54190_c0_g1_i1:510-1121(-)
MATVLTRLRQSSSNFRPTGSASIKRKVTPFEGATYHQRVAEAKLYHESQKALATSIVAHSIPSSSQSPSPESSFTFASLHSSNSGGQPQRTGSAATNSKLAQLQMQQQRQAQQDLRRQRHKLRQGKPKTEDDDDEDVLPVDPVDPQILRVEEYKKERSFTWENKKSTLVRPASAAPGLPMVDKPQGLQLMGVRAGKPNNPRQQ